MLQSPTGPSSSSWTAFSNSFGDLNSRVSPLEVLIHRACDPSMHEPNYAAQVEIAEYINSKKANTPREAALAIARLANNRNPHISMLALSLLSTLVSSCGYPFHLQIATKEFLNELVRRFPERPPPFPNAVMSKILELINDWKEGICAESRWKEDLGNIRDMWRLLTFKGYRFRDFARRTQDQIGSGADRVAANLKSASELESEDREAQSAKLQELIRRGTPRDLAAAQELMKSLAGANPDKKPDYRTQSLNEINKLESKVILLNEMLDNVDVERSGEQVRIKEKFAEGDAYDQVAGILKATRPKLQKWVEEAGAGTEEGDDSESLDTFLQMNDQINTVLNRYEAFKKGDYIQAANPIPQELASGSGGTSLIDFDDLSNSNSSTAPGNAPNSNDLMGLFAASSSNPSNTNTPLPPMESRIGLGLPGMSFSGYRTPTQSQTPPIPSGSPIQQQLGMGGMQGMNIGMIRPTQTPPIPSGSPMQQGMMRGGGSGGMTSTPPIPSGGSPMQMQGMGSAVGGGGMYASYTTQTQPPNYFSSMGAQGQGPARMGMNNGMGMGMGAGMMASSTPQAQSILQSIQTPAQGSSQTQQTQTQAQAKDPFADLAGLF